VIKESKAHKVNRENKDKTAPLDRTVLLVPLEHKARKEIKVNKEKQDHKVFKAQLVLLA